MTAARLVGGALAAALLVLAGCSSSSPAKAPGKNGAAPQPSGGGATTPASATPVAPLVGSCHDLSVSQATDPVDAGRPVSCRQQHTAVTIRVGQLAPLVDGHLVAVDSRTVRAQIARACPTDPGAVLGGDATARRLSRFEVVWFSPSLEQADAGANWYRCDLVALRSTGQLLPLPLRVNGILDQPGALDRFGTCGTTAPGRPGFARVVCSQPHSWRAVDVVDLPPTARYLAKDVNATGNARCKDVAAGRTKGALKYTWSFEWPTLAQWAAGQRYGYCWVPQA